MSVFTKSNNVEISSLYNHPIFLSCSDKQTHSFLYIYKHYSHFHSRIHPRYSRVFRNSGHFLFAIIFLLSVCFPSYFSFFFQSASASFLTLICIAFEILQALFLRDDFFLFCSHFSIIIFFVHQS